MVDWHPRVSQSHSRDQYCCISYPSEPLSPKANTAPLVPPLALVRISIIVGSNFLCGHIFPAGVENTHAQHMPKVFVNAISD